jgi:hypothetical protein
MTTLQIIRHAKDTDGRAVVVAVETVDLPPPTEADFAAAIQEHIDATAKSRGYADGVALAGYTASTVPAWAAEAVAFVAWRDAVWLAAYAKLAAVQAGQREAPEIEGLIAELPQVKWPG